MNLIDISKRFPSAETCNDFIESVRWPNGVECPRGCTEKKISKFQTSARTRTRINPDTGETELKRVPPRILYKCMQCGYQFTVTTGTIFNDTHLDLEKWLMAIALMTNAKKGLSALQMKRDLKVAYKTAWYLNHRIRQAMAIFEGADAEPLEGTVEADETYIGGKYDKRRQRGKYAKAPVFGVVERGGKARTYHMPQVTIKSAIEKIKDNVSIEADAIYTDESALYLTAAGCLKNHNHEIVKHSAKEWVRGDVHTSTIDGYWGLLKRGIIGSFHQISVKHLHRYLSEFQFRWNNREAESMFMLVVIALVIGAALPYAELIGKQSATTPGPSDELLKSDEPF